MSYPFFAYLFRMKYIQRWGLMHASRTENLSEHTLDVVLLTHALCVLRRERCGGQVDLEKALLYALYHDCSEIFTGDLPTPVKYDNPALRRLYGEVEAAANERLLSMLPQEMQKYYTAPLSQEDTEIHLLVKAADKLSALIKCIEEERQGNREFVKARLATEAALQAFPLPEVKIFMEEFLPSYTLTLDELE